MIYFDEDGKPVGPRPEVDQDHRFFPMSTTDMVDRIILAPYAGGKQRTKVENILDSVGVSYGPGEDSDVTIVESQMTGSSLRYTHPYAAEFAGTANYEHSTQHLEEIREDFLDDTDPEDWPIIDLVELSAKDWGTVIEGYRHPSENPEIDVNEYGIKGYQAISVNRVSDSGSYDDKYRNDRAVEYRWDRIAQGLDWLFED